MDKPHHGYAENMDASVVAGLDDFFFFTNERVVAPLSDVKITINFGWRIRETRSVPRARLFVGNSLETERYLAREFDDYLSDEYRSYIEYGADGKLSNVVCNHTETVAVPAELFTGKKGAVYLVLESYSCNYSYQESLGSGETGESISGVVIYYKIQGDNVMLSSRAFL